MYTIVTVIIVTYQSISKILIKNAELGQNYKTKRTIYKMLMLI